MIRCGGWVDRGDGKGWVLDAPSQRAAAPVPAAVAPPGLTGQPLSRSAAERPARADCPDCGKKIGVNKDGTLRKHTCSVDAAPPRVTFDSQEGD